MKTQYSRLILAIGLGLCGLSFGILGARPASGQIQVGGGYPFPRVSELWNFRLDPNSFGAVPKASGGQIAGYLFSVQADQLGRTPVVTTPLNGGYSLWQQGGNGLYYMVLSVPSQPNPNFCGPGIPLTSGDYLLFLAGGYAGIDAKQTMLTGYWARP